ncbi:MAG: GNAT family N-acetyltransferase [Oscillospiraceae bacterium]
MLQFREITEQDAVLLRSYYQDCPFRLCEYSAGVKLMWTSLRPAIAEEAGCLIVRVMTEDAAQFDYPVAKEGGDEEAALAAIEEYCVEQGLCPAFSVVPEEKLPVMARRYPFYRISCIRTWQDYLYRAEDMRTFAGRRYSGQRNHINNFQRKYPSAVFHPLREDDREKLHAFWREFCENFPKGWNDSAASELRMARRFFTHYTEDWVCAGCMELEGRIIGVALGEICGETMIVHIEKALQEFEGVYPTMVREFARCFGEGVVWFNREDDAASKGLRTSKLQYLPAAMGRKYCIELENESHHLTEIPTLQTERLTLRALEERDIPAYNAICLDDELNRWWGYDYRKDLHGELTEDYFLSVARHDFERRLAVNFAVCLDDRCIGEVVLYRFDHRGGAELGCRIAPAEAGHGYGTEAFAAVKDWALYSLGLDRVVAKCYLENEASFHMLSSCMRRVGKDETFFYFETKV